MNIFFAAATKGNDQDITKIIEIGMQQHLKSLGHEVYFYHYNPGDKEYFHSFQEINDKIINADIYIGEMSRASQSLGFQLSYALSLTKPCLYLYYEKRSGSPDKLLAENPSRLLRIRTYDKENYKTVLEKFVNSAAKQLPSHRTSFMSTDQIDAFIGLTAKRRGTSKGEVIRQILDAAAREDKK